MKISALIKRNTGRLLIIGLSTGLASGFGLVLAAEPESQAALLDEERIVQRLKEEIMQELRSGEFLQQQIQIGIRDYVTKQQQAQAKAREQQRSQADKLSENIRPVAVDRDHISGNPDAEISIVEYSDFECPYCKRFHATPKKLVEAFDGKVNWVYRHFPLSFHNPGAQKQAEASECAAELGGNDMFWQYTDQIYERTRAGGQGFPISSLAPLAAELGMDEQKFSECLDSGRYTDRVQEDLDEGTSIGIRGTPGNILLNNRTGKTLVRSGAQPFNVLKADIDRMLSDKE